MIYLASTFSPIMVEKNCNFQGNSITLEEAKELAQDAKSIVGHDITAQMLSAILGFPVKFNRENVIARAGDVFVCVIPKFRASESREFTMEEILNAEVSAFKISIR